MLYFLSQGKEVVKFLCLFYRFGIILAFVLTNNFIFINDNKLNHYGKQMYGLNVPNGND